MVPRAHALGGGLMQWSPELFRYAGDKTLANTTPLERVLLRELVDADFADALVAVRTHGEAVGRDCPGFG
jgi:hypothetical protein